MCHCQSHVLNHFTSTSPTHRPAVAPIATELNSIVLQLSSDIFTLLFPLISHITELLDYMVLTANTVAAVRWDKLS